MSQTRFTDTAAVQWASWYLPELGGSAAFAGLAVVFAPAALPLAVLPLAAIGVQEIGRLGSNARVRRAARLRNRELAAAEQSEVA